MGAETIRGVLAADYRNPWSDRSLFHRPHQLMREDLLADRTVVSLWQGTADGQQVSAWIDRYLRRLGTSKHRLKCFQWNTDHGTLEQVYPWIDSTDSNSDIPWSDIDYARLHAPAILLLPFFEEANARGKLIIYDIGDFWRSFPRSWGVIFDDASERRSLELASGVSYASSVIPEVLTVNGKHVQVVPNGTTPSFIDYGDRHPRTNAKILCYLGSMAPWRFDWQLCLELVSLLPDYNFRFYGAKETIFASQRQQHLESQICARRVLDSKNVARVTNIPHADVPAAMSAASVCLLPFLVTSATTTISPLKIFESIALGIPTVSVRLPQLVDYPLTYFASDAKEYASVIRDIRERDLSDERITGRRFAAAATWNIRSQQLTDFALKVLHSR